MPSRTRRRFSASRARAASRAASRARAASKAASRARAASKAASRAASRAAHASAAASRAKSGGEFWSDVGGVMRDETEKAAHKILQGVGWD